MLRNKNFLIVLFLIVLIITQVYPYKSSEQSGVVKGKVIDAKGNPLQYVNVFFTDGMEGTMTDENGCFEIKTSRFGKRICLLP